LYDKGKKSFRQLSALIPLPSPPLCINNQGVANSDVKNVCMLKT